MKIRLLPTLKVIKNGAVRMLLFTSLSPAIRSIKSILLLFLTFAIVGFTGSVDPSTEHPYAGMEEAVLNSNHEICDTEEYGVTFNTEPTFLNGSFDGGGGPTANSTPANWTKVLTPDISSATVRMFASVSVPGTASPDGGDYMGFRESEAIIGTISNLTIGEEYEGKYYYAVQDHPDNTDERGSPTVKFKVGDHNGPDLHTGPDIYNDPNIGQDVWTDQSFTFTATTTSFDIWIGTRNSVKNTWAFVDGFRMTLAGTTQHYCSREPRLHNRGGYSIHTPSHLT